MGLIHSQRANILPRQSLSQPDSEYSIDNESETGSRPEENLHDLLTVKGVDKTYHCGVEGQQKCPARCSA